jgi:hypothetical protein
MRSNCDGCDELVVLDRSTGVCRAVRLRACAHLFESRLVRWLVSRSLLARLRLDHWLDSDRPVPARLSHGSHLLADLSALVRVHQPATERRADSARTVVVRLGRRSHSLPETGG